MGAGGSGSASGGGGAQTGGGYQGGWGGTMNNSYSGGNLGGLGTAGVMSGGAGGSGMLGYGGGGVAGMAGSGWGGPGGSAGRNAAGIAGNPGAAAEAAARGYTGVGAVAAFAKGLEPGNYSFHTFQDNNVGLVRSGPTPSAKAQAVSAKFHNTLPTQTFGYAMSPYTKPSYQLSRPNLGRPPGANSMQPIGPQRGLDTGGSGLPGFPGFAPHAPPGNSIPSFGNPSTRPGINGPPGGGGGNFGASGPTASHTPR